MNRSLIAILMFGLAASSANGQQASQSGVPASAAVSPNATASQNWAEFPDKQELLRRLGLYEATVQHAQATHLASEDQAKLYETLGGLYQDAAMYPKAEDAMQRAVTLLRSGPRDELATAISHLAVQHIAMGEMRDAEKEQLEALRIREGLGDPVAIAGSWVDLAGFYVKQRHYKAAVDYAQRAMKVLADDPRVEVGDRIAVRYTLAFALCGDGNKDCGQAIPLLKDAIQLSTESFGADSLQVGTGYYLLGYAAWQNGDMADAAAWMARGTARMKVDLGWGHAIYLNAMSQYARFLRKDGQMEAAATAEREIKNVNAVVDARSFTGRSDAFVNSGLQ